MVVLQVRVRRMAGVQHYLTNILYQIKTGLLITSRILYTNKFKEYLKIGNLNILYTSSAITICPETTEGMNSSMVYLQNGVRVTIVFSSAFCTLK